MPSKAELKKTQDFLKNLGISLPEVNEVVSGEKKLESNYPPPTVQSSREMASLQAEHVLLSLEYPALSGIAKTCKECGAPFTTRYKYMGYCGDLCRSAALRKRGIPWWPEGTSEQDKWGGRMPPGNIPPDALRAMKSIVQRVELETQVQVQTTLPDFVHPESSSSQSQENTECPAEFVLVIQDKIDEAPPAPIVQESEDDFSDILDVLDGL